MSVYLNVLLSTVPQMDLGGTKDTELLEILDAKNIDIFITIDGNIEYQQQFKNRIFGTVVIRAVSNRFSDLVHLKEQITKATQMVQKGEIIRVP